MKTFRECYEAVTGLPAGQPGKSHIKINPARHGDTTVNMSVGSGYRVTKDGHEPKHTLDPHVAAIALYVRQMEVFAGYSENAGLERRPAAWLQTCEDAPPAGGPPGPLVPDKDLVHGGGQLDNEELGALAGGDPRVPPGWHRADRPRTSGHLALSTQVTAEDGEGKAMGPRSVVALRPPARAESERLSTGGRLPAILTRRSS